MKRTSKPDENPDVVAEAVAPEMTDSEKNPKLPSGVDPVGTGDSAPAFVPAKEAAPEAPKTEVSTDFNAKVKDKSRVVDPFVPDIDQSVELRAKEVANTEGFELTRGTAAGARIIARSRMRHGE